METLSSDSRQPPDGHEFPDYVESSNELDDKFVRENYQDLYSEQLNERGVKPTVARSVNWSQNRSSFDFSNVPIQNNCLSKVNSVSNGDLSCINSFEGGDEVTLRRTSLEPTLHARSQSLIDMSTISKQKNDRWSLLAEQRKKGYSKLKGLVIPEHVSENEPAPAVNIPEIISHTTSSSFVLETKIRANETMQCHSNGTEPVALPLTSPPWTSNANTFPKYSPAFKRKSLQVYSQKVHKPEEPQPAIKPQAKPDKSATNKIESEELRLDNLSDSPKSLESITSPTRSDCSFDYVTNSLNKKYPKQEPNRTYKETFTYVSKLHKDIGKSEDESDNDSAVSSSQSSYISRCSPPPSPTRSCEMLDYDNNIRPKSDIQDVDKYGNLQCRLLKAASVEAINRKNILASAKCRSGRDLKVGSPVIQRKYEDKDATGETPQVQPPKQEICQVEVRPPVKQKRSISCEDAAPKSVLNGDGGAKDGEGKVDLSIVVDRCLAEVGVSPVSSKIPEKNLISLKPVGGSLKNFSAQLRETKVPPKNNFKTSALLKNNKSMSVTDLRKSFEKFGNTPPPLPQNVSPVTPKEPKARTVQVEKQKKIEILDKKSKSNGEVVKETVKPATTAVVLKRDVDTSTDTNRRTIILYPEFVGGSIGITLAGGTDYETKEITVHKIRYGSVAYNDGTIKKGDKIVSINEKSTAGLTHAESVELLKEAVSQFVLVVEDGREEALPSPRKSASYELPEAKDSGPAPPAKDVTHVLTLTKDGAGLGFSIEGGKDSPQGDLPLRVKKIFQGGLAEKNGGLCGGDELLAINGISLTNLSRIETWSLMKKLPDGDVTIHIHR
jgi:predicted CxxxxCH...CXXCH cytochrome family protein